MRRFPWQNAVYFALYTSGIYGMVLSPPVTTFAAMVTDPLRRAIASDVARIPLAIRILMAFIVFDCVAYWIHRAAHASRILWFFHRVHHSDPNLGPFTTFRFHVVEIAWRMAIEFAPMYVLSITVSIPNAVLFAFVVFNMLAHSAITWSFGPMGRVIVSPVYHAVHHERDERSNYGMFLTIWDIAFATPHPSGPPPDRTNSQPGDATGTGR